MKEAVPLNDSRPLHSLEEDEEFVYISAVQPDGVPCLNALALEAEPLIGNIGRPSQLTGPCQTQHQQVQDQAIVLHYKAAELQAPDDTIAVRVQHILVGNGHIVLSRHVVSQVMVHNQPKQPVDSKPHMSMAVQDTAT